jgi:hypothetical protein
MQHQRGRSCKHNGVVNAKATLDLIIVDIPKGLPVPTMSTLIDVLPPWNKSEELFLKPVFVFTEDYLQDGGSIIVIHLHQVLVKSTILEYCVEYNFETHKK